MANIPAALLRRPLFVGISIFLLGTPFFALHTQGTTSVIDGYDRGEFARTADAIAFDPDVIAGWTLYYTTGRHLRVLNSHPGLNSQTLAYFSENTSGIVRLRTQLDSRPQVPAIAVYENTLPAKIRLRSWDGGGRWSTFGTPPNLSSLNFDVVLGPDGQAFPVEWIYTGLFDGIKKTRLFHVYPQGQNWKTDTLAIIIGYVYSFNNLLFQRHGLVRKTIAVGTDSIFSVHDWDGQMWRQYQTPPRYNDDRDVHGGTMSNGNPFWLRGKQFIELTGSGLVVETTPVSSFTYARCIAAYRSADGAVHAIHEVLQGNSPVQLHYSKRTNMGWIAEIMPFTGGNDAAITTMQDTVIVAAAKYFEGKIYLLTRYPNGTWATRLAEAAGDVGSDLSVAHDTPTGKSAIAYYDRTNGDLKIVHGELYYSGAFTDAKVMRVDSAGDVGRMPSAMFAKDSLYVVYLDDSNGLLKYGWQTRTGNQFSAWKSEIIDSVGYINTLLNLRLNANGKWQVAYENARHEEIRLATRENGKWITATISKMQSDSPGEIGFFYKRDTLCVSLVQDGNLRLFKKKDAATIWISETIPHLAAAVYAVCAADDQGKIHAVYRTRNGFRDDIRHVYNDGAIWQDINIITTSANGMRLRLKPIQVTSTPVLMLAFADDSRPQLYCLNGINWVHILEGQRFLSDTAIDFFSFGFFTITMYYRALVEPESSFGSTPFGELVEYLAVSIVDAVESNTSIGASTTEFSTYPNPFNAATTIEFNLPHSASATVRIYNTIGQEVRTLVNQTLTAGKHTVNWDGRNNWGEIIAGGIYLVRLKAADITLSRKLFFLK